MQDYKLFPGTESEHKIRLLIQAANLKSENKIAALVDHYCNGTPQNVCATLYDLSQPTISAAAGQLNRHYNLAYAVVYSK